MPDKEFLETYPLYKKFDISSYPKYIGGVPKPSINLYCGYCKSVQTFKMTNSYSEEALAGIPIPMRPPPGPVMPIKKTKDDPGTIDTVVYTCTACERWHQFYLLRFFEDRDYVEKVGQFPPWSINIERELEKELIGHVDIYKKGLICESQGYGIGAYAYYRRIVELLIDKLLDGIISITTDTEIQDLVIHAKKEHNATDKIKIVKDVLPNYLRPKGYNPFNLIYDSLSVGIHSDTDENCLMRAGYIRTSLVFLMKKIESIKIEQKEFTDSLQNINKVKSINGKSKVP